MVVTGVDQGGSVAARQQAVTNYMDAVRRRIDQGMYLDEGSPVAEAVRMMRSAPPAMLVDIGAWACVLHDGKVE